MYTCLYLLLLYMQKRVILYFTVGRIKTGNCMANFFYFETDLLNYKTSKFTLKTFLKN